MYHVTSWNTNEIIRSFDKLSSAKRHARSLGHTNLDNGSYYAPIAYVANDKDECVYNPRFRK